jgi:hypothetical protein
VCKARSVSWIAIGLVFVTALWPVSALLQEILEIDGEIYRDPTQPPGTVFEQVGEGSLQQDVSVISLSNFTLSFVRSGGINPVAVINNKTVTEGDDVGGATVARIQAGAVVLLIEGQEQVLNLYRQPVRRDLTGESLEN